MSIATIIPAARNSALPLNATYVARGVGEGTVWRRLGKASFGVIVFILISSEPWNLGRTLTACGYLLHFKYSGPTRTQLSNQIPLYLHSFYKNQSNPG